MRISDWSSDVCSSDLIENAWLSAPNRTAEFVKNYRLKTDLTITKIQDSFASPEAMSFWELPEFIATLEAAGFSGHRHRLHYYTLLVYPLLLCRSEEHTSELQSLMRNSYAASCLKK